MTTTSNHPQLGHSPVKPILIIGSPGSGTSLLYQILCLHRDAAYISHNMFRAGLRRTGRFLGDRRKALFMLQNLIHRDRDSNLPNEADAFWMMYFGYYNYMTEQDYSEEMATYFRKKVLQVQSLWGRPRFVNKNLQNSFRVRLLNAIFPDAKFVHIIRDGRAVAFSILNKKDGGATSPILLVGFKDILGEKYQSNRSELYNYGLAWAEYVRKAREASAFGRDRYYEVRYENLIAEPYNELKRILDFCELDWYSEFEDRMPPIKDMNKKWIQKATKDQLVEMDESTIDMRRNLGYDNTVSLV
ncbi:sulfotransferase domain-containing protein [Candidatus Nitrososphaera gargensis Ga9.2]|uniref:Sulfotransferase domain-containing protein n=1 Tax=Nitrososphaera gargensis (strain Ga9.2) TaxID=1237085 RepID=K0IL76_NITGG|nr:sulfotransferase [Candidatus Nitrososphaera gargensis]AFU60203.1 sulfotransferase domain-containing protein [Candidatus Nitrososphaera gargensis Ga9.2]